MNHQALQKVANNKSGIRYPRGAAAGRSMNVRRRRRTHLSLLVARYVAAGGCTENRAMARRAQEKEWRITDRYERRIPHAPRFELEEFDE